MDRVIKFRVWVGRKMKDNVEALRLLYNESSHPSLKISEYVLMQFTGLHDKNGKEIYEGDILRDVFMPTEWHKTNYIAYEVFFHGNDHCDSNIGFQMNRMHFQGAIGGGSYSKRFKPMYTREMVVIGNIFENPELIKQ